MTIFRITTVIMIVLLMLFTDRLTEASERTVKSVYLDGVHVNLTMPRSNDILQGLHSELECLALNIYFEARGESIRGQELVAQVTMNRLRMRGYPKTICGVVTQPRQFVWTRDGKSDMPTDLVAYARAKLIAVQFMYFDYTMDLEEANLITNFHSYKTTPKSWDGLVRLAYIEGNHRFYIQTRPIVFVQPNYITNIDLVSEYLEVVPYLAPHVGNCLPERKYSMVALNHFS